MKNPQWKDRNDDDLTGSPELFATNLLLVRAIDNSIDAIEIKRNSDGITVQLFAEDRDYDPETLTDDPSRWDTLRDRFRAMTDFDTENENEGTLKPNLPDTGNVEAIQITFQDKLIRMALDYS